MLKQHWLYRPSHRTYWNNIPFTSQETEQINKNQSFYQNQSQPPPATDSGGVSSYNSYWINVEELLQTSCLGNKRFYCMFAPRCWKTLVLWWKRTFENRLSYCEHIKRTCYVCFFKANEEPTKRLQNQFHATDSGSGIAILAWINHEEPSQTSWFGKNGVSTFCYALVWRNLKRSSTYDTFFSAWTKHIKSIETVQKPYRFKHY